MLRTLLESNAPRQRRRGSTATSIVVHTLIIGGAVAATASARSGAEPARTTGRDTVIRVWPERRSPEPSRPATRSPAATRGPAPPLVRPSIDLGQLRPHILDPLPVDIDPRQLLGADSLPAGRIVGSGGPPGPASPGGPGGEPATAATVDRPAAMLAPPRPRYPDRLRAAGVTGRVVVRLVVDTTGRPEPASVEIRESSHDFFTQAVRAVLPSLRFTPAEVGGRKVRMLVDLPFEFRLNE